MNESDIPQAETAANIPIEWRASRPYRILVVDDEPCMRQANAKMLIDTGYRVDAVEDGAAAWETLSRNSYDLLITDNNMPKVTGTELVRKVREARMTLPVIMATGTLPEEDFAARASVSATLLKPYSIADFLGTVKKVLTASAAIVMFQLCLPGLLQAQDAKQAPELPLRTLDTATPPTAVTLSTVGKCECSEDGVTFTKLESGRIFEQGAVIRTGEGARADLFFRRTGTTVRIQAGTELRIEKMAITTGKDGLPLVHTLLDLRAGRIFTVVRSTVIGSTLEIRNAAGRSVVEGSGVGRYIITADGTHVAAAGSVIPLKVIGENGITILAAGQQFSKKDGQMIPASTSLWVKDLIELDELQASTESLSSGETASKP